MIGRHKIFIQKHSPIGRSGSLKKSTNSEGIQERCTQKRCVLLCTHVNYIYLCIHKYIHMCVCVMGGECGCECALQACGRVDAHVCEECNVCGHARARLYGCTSSKNFPSLVCVHAR